MGWLKDLFSTEEEQEKSKSKAKKINNLLEEGSDKDFMGHFKDNEENWIQMEITIMAPYSELIKLKNALSSKWLENFLIYLAFQYIL